jgi:hypothetical protein
MVLFNAKHFMIVVDIFNLKLHPFEIGATSLKVYPIEEYGVVVLEDEGLKEVGDGDECLGSMFIKIGMIN